MYMRACICNFLSYLVNMKFSKTHLEEANDFDLYIKSSNDNIFIQSESENQVTNSSLIGLCLVFNLIY